MTKGLALLPALAFCAAAFAADSPLAPLARLEGHCWKREFAEGGSWDEHCFAWAYDGKFLRDTHIVTGKRGPYGGETLYRYDAAAKRIVYSTATRVMPPSRKSNATGAGQRPGASCTRKPASRY
jgi:hypothetical protein